MTFTGLEISEERWKGIFAAGFFIVTSSSMIFLNKSVLSVYQFECPYFIMALQMTFSYVVLRLLSVFGLLVIPVYSEEVQMWPICVFYSVHSITSLTAIGRMTVPMYTALKRCGPLLIIAFSVFILRKPLPSYQTLLSVILITLGCLIAGLGDMKFTWSGYLFCSVSLIAQSIYLIFTQKASEYGVTALSILYVTSYSTIPFFIVGSLFLEHAELYKNSEKFKDTTFVASLSLQVLLGMILNYALYLCTTLNSALTTSLVGVIKSVLQTSIGFFAFGGIQVNSTNVTGLTLNVLGGIMYTGAKYRENSRKMKHELLEQNRPLNAA